MTSILLSFAFTKESTINANDWCKLFFSFLHVHAWENFQSFR